ncbi:ECF transporter S component [Schnuerera sp. xch1]|uniref:ECF transporter S component n=1 Tax=Schnuerera sp. xch1 TaxID=2874283 RepID=UPI001CBDCB17|nr:ECF transporter S component [Schnuerera sp. xch1]MBZ2174871.1 ECF transporter S component [Schnuerera sp. xch1]
MEIIRREHFNTRTLVKVSILGAIAFLLMLFEFPLWFAPVFLELDFSDVPALIGSFAVGPVAGILVQLVKNILNLVLQGTDTAGVGELANFAVGSMFAFTAGLVYHRKKTFKNAIIGMIIGIITMTISISLVNYYVMIPLYAKLFGWPLEQIVAMGTAVNKYVVDFKTLILFAVVPFNIVKGILVTLATTLLYKKVSPILH